MSDPLVLAIDQGTTSTRALVFNARGEIIAKAQKELPLITPKSGWVEQDATQI
jgi:glycerol kinase